MISKHLGAALASFVVTGCMLEPHNTESAQIDRTVTPDEATLSPAPELTELSWMIGVWSFDVFTIQPDGTEEIWLQAQQREIQFERNSTWIRSDIYHPTQPLETQLNFLTYDLVEKRWVSIGFSNTGYRDIQFSEDSIEDGRLEFTGAVCDLLIAPQGCRDVILKLSEDEFHILNERYDGDHWIAFSRTEYQRIG